MKPTTTVIIPSRNEPFLSKTVDDLCAKARGEIEIYAILDGWWPDHEWMQGCDKQVHFIHFGSARGQRPGYNAGAELAKGQFLMFLDAHCMVSEGFDVALAKVCRPDWVCVPTRLRLDAENWTIKPGRRPTNYLYLDLSNRELNGKLWDQKNRDRSLDGVRVDDLIACQGSCYFMPKALWRKLELFDVEHYGTFRKDPQEVVFKNWTSGGRCVRVKDAWYAHLHKGKQYGRGYSTRTFDTPEGRDWDKGDEYVQLWWTDSAWSKQTISLRQIIRERFADMPGWENHEWIKGASVEQPKRRLPRTYQVLKLPDGRYFTQPRPEREGSKFWNEGRWATFVAPLLPGDPHEQTFVEMGCEAGLFLKLAQDYGYRQVIGVEKNKTPVAVAERYRDAIGYGYRVLKRSLGTKFHGVGSFDIDELPLADVTLLSTFHYHLDLNSWIKYLDRLQSKSCYVLVVSVTEFQRWRWRPGTSLNQVRAYFAGWDEVGTVQGVPQEGDPAPRSLYSVLFKSPRIRRVPMASITRNAGRSDDGLCKLVGRVMTGEEIDVQETQFYAEWQERKPQWNDKILMAFVEGKYELVRGLVEVGPKDPILVTGDNLRLCDGGHRATILQTMGYESAIVRDV